MPATTRRSRYLAPHPASTPLAPQAARPANQQVAYEVYLANPCTPNQVVRWYLYAANLGVAMAAARHLDPVATKHYLVRQVQQYLG